MAQSDLKIVINVSSANSDKVIAGLRKNFSEMEKDLQKLNDTQKKSEKVGDEFTTSLKSIGMALGTAGAAALLAKKAFEFGKQGAELEFVRDKFDRLTESIGSTSDAMLIDLRKATGGIYSDAQLMQSATDFMALGFAKTSEEATRLATVAGGLNMNMNQLVLTLANKTTMRFDQLGVAVAGFDDKLEKLKKTGLSTDEAFKEAFLQQAEEQLKRVGSAADSDLGAFMRLEAGTTDLFNELKIMASQGLGPVVKYLGEVVSVANLATRAMREGNLTFAEAVNINTKLRLGLIDYNAALEEVTNSTNILTTATGKTMHGAVDLRKTEEELEAALTPTNDAIERTSNLSGEASKQYNEYATAAYYAKDASVVLSKVLEAELNQELSELEKVISGKLGPSMDDYIDRQEDLQEALGETKLKHSNLLGEMQQVKDKIDELEAKEYLTEKQRGELDELFNKYANMRSDLKDIDGDYENLQEQYRENAAAHDEATKRILFDLLVQRGEMANLSLTERETFQAMLSDIAEKWGLIDQTTLESTQVMDQALQNLAAGQGMSDVQTALTIQLATIQNTISGLEKLNGMDIAYTITQYTNSVTGPTGQPGSYDPGTGSFYPSGTIPKTTTQSNAGKVQQHGADYIVPPGFNENFMAGRASSGERVTITPRQGNTYNQTWNVYTNGGKQSYERDYNMRKALAN